MVELTKDSVGKRYKTRNGYIAVITDYCEHCPTYGHAGYIERDATRYLGKGKWEKYISKEGTNWTRQGRDSQFGGELSRDLVNAL